MNAPQSVRFEKYHGTGNDFVVVDAMESVPDRPRFADIYCDREDGVGPSADGEYGADGVLFLALEDRYTPPRVVMTLVQPDGSVAPTCGNASRCAARWAAGLTDADEFMIDTPAGTSHAVVDANGVTVEVAVPSFDPREFAPGREAELVEERLGELTVTVVDVGAPHAVAFLEDVESLQAADVEALAPPVRHADVFDRGVNVTLAAVGTDGRLHVRTYERGVERETRSSGTGAVAAVVVARRLGYIPDDPDRQVSVATLGGALRVTVPRTGPAYLWGPTAREFAGEVPASPLAREAEADADPESGTESVDVTTGGNADDD
jgi:diaminopimelate epimerase